MKLKLKLVGIVVSVALVVALLCGCAPQTNLMDEGEGIPDEAPTEEPAKDNGGWQLVEGITGGTNDATEALRQSVMSGNHPPDTTPWMVPMSARVHNFGSKDVYTAICPIFVHNEGIWAVEKKVTTFSNDPWVDISLEQPLYDSDPRNVVAVESSIGETLEVQNASQYSIRVGGLVDNQVRVVTVSYFSPTPKLYKIYYKTPPTQPAPSDIAPEGGWKDWEVSQVTAGYNLPPDGAGNWVTLTAAGGQPTVGEVTVSIDMNSTAEIIVQLDVPREHWQKLPPMWEFWITRAELGAKGEIAVMVEYNCRWMISSYDENYTRQLVDAAKLEMGE